MSTPSKRRGARVRHILADGLIVKTERHLLDVTGKAASPLLASTEDGAATLDRAHATRERMRAALAPEGG
jgi:hypothetical protein